MKGRTYSAQSSYRYGFNGQEQTSEVAANTTTALYWEYDARVGRRWNMDPKPNVSESVYGVFGNNPVLLRDLLGDTSKFFGNDARLLYENTKGNGTSVYVVANDQFSALKSKYKNRDQLTRELTNVAIKAYTSEDEAAGAWATEGFAGTKNDPQHLERAARIFHATAMGDKKISDLYILGSTVIGHKSNDPQVSQETNQDESKLTLNGKDILDYKHTKTARGWWGVPYSVQITVQTWDVSGMIHTHQPGNDNYSISEGDAAYGGTYGGDFGLALKYNVYLVPTSSSVPYIMYKLRFDERDRTLYFPNIYEGQKYMLGERKRILLK